LCEVPQQQRFQDLMFRLLGTLGLRVTPLQRATLPRAVVTLQGPQEELLWKKRSFSNGESALKPEFESLRLRALELGLTPRELLQQLENYPE